MIFLLFKMDGRELGIGIVPYCPVGRGLFAGKKVVENIPQESYLVRLQSSTTSFLLDRCVNLTNCSNFLWLAITPKVYRGELGKEQDNLLSPRRIG